MPKMKKVSNADLDKLSETCYALAEEVHDYTQRLEQGYRDELTEPLRKALAVLTAARALDQLGTFLVKKASLNEQAVALETKFRKRQL